MNRFLVVIIMACLAATANASDKGGKGKGKGKGKEDGSIIIAETFSAPNSYSGPMPEPFDAWCNEMCFPTVSLEVVEPKKAKSVGYVHAWGKEPTGTEDGSTIQFKEFIIGEFKGGQVWSISTDGGHAAGTFADPTLIPPKFGVIVLMGGAEGEVIGGTGKYKNAEGGYSTRLKLEADIEGNFIYYDELYFRYRNVKIK